MRYFTILLMATLWITSGEVLSASNQKDVQKLFNYDKARKQLETINERIDSSNIQLIHLKQSVTQLNKLVQRASDCVERQNEKIVIIEDKLTQFFGENHVASEKKYGPDLNYLQTQQQDLEQKKAACRLILIQANEALELHEKKILSLQQKITFTRGNNIIYRLRQLPANWQDFHPPTVDTKSIITNIDWIIYLPAIFCLTLVLNVILSRFIQKPYRNSIKYFLLNAVLLLIVLVLSSYFFFTPTLFSDNEKSALAAQTILVALMGAGSLFLYNYLFLLRPVLVMLQGYGLDIKFLKRLGLVIIAIYFLRKIGLSLLAIGDAGANLTQLFEDLMLLISLGAMIYFAVTFYWHHREWFKTNLPGLIVYKLLAVLVSTILLLDFLGYYVLAVTTAYILFSLLLVGTLGTELILGMNNVYRLLCYHPPYKFYLKKWFGYTNEPPYIELLLLKVISQVVVTIGLSLLFAHLIGEASYFIDNFLEHLLYGFKVAGFEVILLQWLIALVVFCLMALLSRYIAVRISLSQQFNEEEETQVALASIFLYASFSISVVIALLVAGFSFTSLAIIAGALSVGIGLGLQPIVNNFLSGIILLIEKPIKAGDRILVDGVEGFVKKVRVRSTQILTPTQEDIIIPNSDLITHQVTNYMFSNKITRIKCRVGVAYGSDIDLVHKVLLEVAQKHPDVVDQENIRPMVLFHEFGESTLNFELWAPIFDVNKKYVAGSELNFAIDKAFREHNITIAFPQRDIHIIPATEGG